MGTEPEQQLEEGTFINVDQPARPPLRPEEFEEWKAQKVSEIYYTGRHVHSTG